METSKKGYEFIKSHEGLRLKDYLCPGGVWTIGYGHTSGVKEGDVITKEQAKELLKKDIKEIEDKLNSLNLNLTQNQFDALVSFIFNVGWSNFKSSTLLKKIKINPDDPSIRGEFGRWVFANGKKLNGLIKRRKDEASLYFDET